MKLLIPDDLRFPGRDLQALEHGFATLATDDKGALVRLDARDGAVFYAAFDRQRSAMRVIRPASAHDRLQRFRRPPHLDALAPHCCGQPCAYMGLYDDGSGTFFDLDVLPEQAEAWKQGQLFNFFTCAHCQTPQPLPVK